MAWADEDALVRKTMAQTLERDYPLFEDPVTGARWLSTPAGRWLEVDDEKLAALAAEQLTPMQEVLVGYLSRAEKR